MRMLVFLIHKKACDIIDRAGIGQGWENINNGMRKCLCAATFSCTEEMLTVEQRRVPKCLDWTVVSNQAFLNLVWLIRLLKKFKGRILFLTGIPL